MTTTSPEAKKTSTLQQVWTTLGEDSCPYIYNFHMHTVFSDGKLTPANLIEQAIAIGLKGLAITDHHSIKGYETAQHYLQQRQKTKPQKQLPYLWIGVEINADLLGTDVHILGYDFDPNHQKLRKYLQGERLYGKAAKAEKVIDILHQAGGLAVLAHPARYRLPATELIPEAAHLGIDGIEAYYAYANSKPWKPSLRETGQMKQLSQEYSLLTTCGTDTHGLNLLERI